ncbi:MAG: ABC transporter substrate-binding protein [Oscillospiraceae bacterium]|jgi:peptide/nickel transport system substrate-binding protein|nr:ABC transporter substrate-binding protein [Oscillospiraceae bacterium]
MNTKPLRRILASVLPVCLLVLLACNGSGNTDADGTEATLPPTEVQTEKADKGTLSIPFAKRDVLNPYLAESALNRQLTSLLYEGLFTTDSTFLAVPVLAAKATQENALEWVITLQEGRVFSDGTPVSAEDVLYSFTKAKASTRYKENLKYAKSLKLETPKASAATSNESVTPSTPAQLRLTVTQANAYLPADLDFPIVPNGSADAKKLTNTEAGYYFNEKSTPVGTGRYKLTKGADAFTLTPNPNYPDEAPGITSIQLIGVTSTEALPYGLEMGSYQFFYDDLTDGNIVRVTATTAKVPLTNFVFLGLHGWKAPFIDKKFRQAVAGAIDTKTLMNDAYRGYGEGVNAPFPPAWYGLPQGAAAPAHKSAALLTELGYSETDTNGIRSKKGGKPLTVKLLTNADNAFKSAAATSVKRQLKTIGIDIQINALPEAEYLAAIKAKNYDCYIGEVKLTPSLNLAPLLLDGGVATGGLNAWGPTSQAYLQMLKELLTPDAFVAVYQDEVPFLALGYRCGFAAISRSLTSRLECREADLFENISAWN